MSRPAEVAVLRVELLDIEPLIWRRAAVLTSMNLQAVHRAIQAAMGWPDYHLWEFETNGQKCGMLVPDEPEWNDRIINATATKLSSLLSSGVREIAYVYDMGDNWQHRIIIEKLKAGEPGVRYPQFLGGERRCPPEDCGGAPGYYEFIENIAGKQKEARKVALDWYGGPFDPDEIDSRRSSQS